MLIMVNALQLTLHLPIMSMVFPENAMTYIETLFPIVMFDFLEENEWFKSLFTPVNQTAILNIRD